MRSRDHTTDMPGLAALADLLAGRRAVVLAGAGCSTESGIPDYRGPDTNGRTSRPMPYSQFVGHPEARARYWARSAIGWPRIRDARPNAAHRALARLEQGGVVAGIITQNVDGLHQTAGSRRVVELHGSLAHVCCLACGARSTRAAFQDRILEMNPSGQAPLRRPADSLEATPAPDGDAEVALSATETFRVPGCEACKGILKPDVVFFGESVPKPRVADAWRLFDAAEILLVVGSSLTVYSGRRFSDRARAEGRPIAIVNIGPTRADDSAAIKVEARLGRILPQIAEVLLPARAGGG
jgi:NAD+-dependent protein deacetylase sirtuin 4